MQQYQDGGCITCSAASAGSCTFLSSSIVIFAFIFLLLRRRADVFSLFHKGKEKKYLHVADIFPHKHTKLRRGALCGGFEVKLYIFVRAPAVAEAKESAGGAGGAAAADADVCGAADAADAADTAADVLAAADASVHSHTQSHTVVQKLKK